MYYINLLGLSLTYYNYVNNCGGATVVYWSEPLTLSLWIKGIRVRFPCLALLSFSMVFIHIAALHPGV